MLQLPLKNYPRKCCEEAGFVVVAKAKKILLGYCSHANMEELFRRARSLKDEAFIACFVEVHFSTKRI